MTVSPALIGSQSVSVSYEGGAHSRVKLGSNSHELLVLLSTFLASSRGHELLGGSPRSELRPEAPAIGGGEIVEGRLCGIHRDTRRDWWDGVVVRELGRIVRATGEPSC